MPQKAKRAWHRGKRIYTDAELVEHRKAARKRDWKKRLPYIKAWEKAHPDRRPAYKRKCELKNKYGLTLEDFAALSESQGGGCAICKKVSENRTLHVDHDHNTGKVRGLLCTPCNIGLGLFRDNVSLMEIAIRYLKAAR